MGYRAIFLCADEQVAKGRVIATPVENLLCYYVDPANSDFAKAGLEFTTDGESNLVGFHTNGNYGHAVSECFALLGMIASADYINGIAVVDVKTSVTKGSLTVSSVAGASAGTTKLTVSETLVAGGKLYAKAQASTSPASPDALGYLDDSWVPVDGDITLTSGHKVTVVEVNGSGQVLASGSATVVVA